MNKTWIEAAVLRHGRSPFKGTAQICTIKKFIYFSVSSVFSVAKISVAKRILI